MFHSMQELYVTMTAGTGTKNGEVCKLSGNMAVSVCSAGDAFDGVCGVGSNGIAGVLLRGFVTVKYSGTTAPTVGVSKLVADGNGGVKVDATNGKGYLVCSVDTTGKYVSIVL